MIEIKEYLTTAGRSPFADWLLALKEVTTRARVLARLNRIRLGNFGDTKHVDQVCTGILILLVLRITFSN